VGRQTVLPAEAQPQQGSSSSSSRGHFCFF
jgi:hypothetical protein